MHGQTGDKSGSRDSAIAAVGVERQGNKRRKQTGRGRVMAEECWTLCSSGGNVALHLTSPPDTARPSDLCGMSFKSSSDPCLFRPDIMKTLNRGS